MCHWLRDITLSSNANQFISAMKNYVSTWITKNPMKLTMTYWTQIQTQTLVVVHLNDK